jgi:hypothetical protein
MADTLLRLILTSAAIIDARNLAVPSSQAPAPQLLPVRSRLTRTCLFRFAQ